MITLATADDPDVLCVQEVPAWALGRFTVGDVAARPAFGPLPITASLGRRLTAPNHGLLRSAFAGQGNGMVVSQRLRVLAHDALTLNAWRFRSAQARALGLRPRPALWGSGRSRGSAGRRNGASSRPYASKRRAGARTSWRTCIARASRPTS